MKHLGILLTILLITTHLQCYNPTLQHNVQAIKTNYNFTKKNNTESKIKKVCQTYYK